MSYFCVVEILQSQPAIVEIDACMFWNLGLVKKFVLMPTWCDSSESEKVYSTIETMVFSEAIDNYFKRTQPLPDGEGKLSTETPSK